MPGDEKLLKLLYKHDWVVYSFVPLRIMNTWSGAIASEYATHVIIEYFLNQPPEEEE